MNLISCLPSEEASWARLWDPQITCLFRACSVASRAHALKLQQKQWQQVLNRIVSLQLRRSLGSKRGTLSPRGRPSFRGFRWCIIVKKVYMRCQYCLDAGKENSFTKGCDKFKKDALSKHALTVYHKAAIEAKSCRRDMQPWSLWNSRWFESSMFTLIN